MCGKFQQVLIPQWMLIDFSDDERSQTGVTINPRVFPIDVATSGYFALFVTNNNQVYQLGTTSWTEDNKYISTSNTAFLVSKFKGMKARRVIARCYSAAAIVDTAEKKGLLYIWGLIWNGADGGVVDPILLEGSKNVIDAAFCETHAMCLTNDSIVYTWGKDLKYEIKGDIEYVKVAVSRYFCSAISKEGHLYTWHRGDTKYIGTPKLIRGQLSGEVVVDLAQGCEHIVVLTESGNVFAFGSNEFRQCGTIKKKVHKEPVLIPLGFECLQIACGGYSTVILEGSLKKIRSEKKKWWKF